MFFTRQPEDFEILHGDVLGLPDTMNFLKSLSELDAFLNYGKSHGKRQIREQKAAAGLFNWEVHNSVFQIFFVT